MIINRTWNKYNQTLNISYCDSQGRRQMYSKQFHHWKTYEYDKNGEYDTWNHRKCRQIFKDASQYEPNDFDIFEFMYELPKDFNEILHKTYSPRFYAFDIETEVSNEFPTPDKQGVTAISLVSPELDVIVYGLRKLTDEKYKLFQQHYREWIDNCEFAKLCLGSHEPKILYQRCNSEAELLELFFTKIVPNTPAIGGWNSYRFDWDYLVHRAEHIFGKIPARKLVQKSSPTYELSKISWAEANGDKFTCIAPAHVAVLDYMELVKKYDYSLRPYESYSLDWVSNAAFSAHKIKYKGTLQQLYERDTEWYYYYNAIDSLLVQLINKKLKCIEVPTACSGITLVPYLDCLGQVALTTANIFEEFYKDNKKVVYDFDEIARYKVEYEGAFCGCVPGRYSWNVCDDFASLYPSAIRTCNLSFENLVGTFYDYEKLKPYMNNPSYIIYGPTVYENEGTPKNPSAGKFIGKFIDEKKIEQYKDNSEYFISVMGSVYKNDKDYAFKRMQTNKAKLRNYYKYASQKLDAELLSEIDRLIEKKEAS